MQARKRPVEKIALDSIVGNLSEGFRIVRIEAATDERHVEMISGTTREIAQVVARIVKTASSDCPPE
jgi:hypothetical protein